MRIALALVVLAALAGSASASPGSAAAVCRASQLSVKLTGQDGGVGHLGAYVVLTNRGPAACTLKGYLGFRLLNARRAPMPTTVAHGTSYLNPKDPGPRLLTLKPGGRAKAWLEWSDVPSGNEPLTKACEPTAAYLRVTPPGSTTGIVVTFGEVVCGHGGLVTAALTR